MQKAKLRMAALLMAVSILPLPALAAGKTKMNYDTAKKQCLKEKPHLKAKELQTCIKAKRK